MAGLVSSAFVTYRLSWIKTCTKLRNEVTLLTNEKEVDQKELLKLKEEKKDYEIKIEHLKKELKNSETARQTSENVCNIELKNQQNQICQLNNFLILHKSEKEQINNENEKYKQAIKQHQDEIGNNKLKIVELGKELFSMKQQYDELNTSFNNQQTSHNQLQHLSDNNQQLINKLRSYINSIPFSCITIKDESDSKDLIETMHRFGFIKQSFFLGYNNYFVRDTKKDFSNQNFPEN